MHDKQSLPACMATSIASSPMIPAIIMKTDSTIRKSCMNRLLVITLMSIQRSNVVFYVFIEFDIFGIYLVFEIIE